MAEIVAHRHKFDPGVERVRGMRVTKPVGTGVPQLCGERRIARQDMFPASWKSSPTTCRSRVTLMPVLPDAP